MQRELIVNVALPQDHRVTGTPLYRYAINPVGQASSPHPVMGPLAVSGMAERLVCIYRYNFLGSPDQCPSDPKKTSPGQCGCGVADTDTDLVFQCQDKNFSRSTRMALQIAWMDARLIHKKLHQENVDVEFLIPIQILY